MSEPTTLSEMRALAADAGTQLVPAHTLRLALQIFDDELTAAVAKERSRCSAVAAPDQWAYKTVNAYTCLTAAQGAIESGRQPQDWTWPPKAAPEQLKLELQRVRDCSACDDASVDPNRVCTEHA